MKRLIERALERRFVEAGLVIFDVKITQQPLIKGVDGDPTWGGYRVLFKTISHEAYEKLGADIERLRIRSLSISPRHEKSFKIEISKYELTRGKIEAEVDHYAFFAYSKEMIAAEKLRAVCQQMDGYERVAHPKARARDFYDIWSICNSGVDLANERFLAQVRDVFRQKDVPIEWMGRIKDEREFHRVDWPAVRDSISTDTKSFDYYFDFVVDLVDQLEALRKE